MQVRYKRFALLIWFCATLLFLPSVFAQEATSIEACTTDGFFHILIEPSALPPASENEQPIIPASYVIKLSTEENEPIGLIIPLNAKVTVYSHFKLQLEVYTVRPDTSPGGYRFVHTEPITTSSSMQEKNFYNANFTSRYPAIGCDASNLLATRPVNVVGGRPLDADAEVTDQGIPTRRTEFSLNNDFYTHEMMVIRRHGNFPVQNQTIKGVASFHLFNNSRLSFQLVQLGDEVFNLGLPTLSNATDYYLFANKDVTVNVLRELSDGTTLPVFTGVAFTLGQLTQLKNLEVEEPFTLLRADAVQIYPYRALSGTYDPEDYLEIDMTQPSPSRSFASGTNFRPIAGSAPRIYTVDGRFFGYLTAGRTATVSSVDPNGQLVYTDGGGQYLLDAWLVE